MYQYQQFAILLRGGGDIATGIALRLYRSGFRRLIILETAHPMAVRRRVAFSEAVYEGLCTVEGITAALAPRPEEIAPLWDAGCIPVMVDPQGVTIPRLRPEVVIEATLAKRNVGVGITDAPLVIGVGPGFTVGENVHCIVETNRGPNLGRVLYSGSVSKEIRTVISGVIRGLLRAGTPVTDRIKVGDVDPRDNTACHHVSDKAFAIGGGILEAILGRFNRPCYIRRGILHCPVDKNVPTA